MDISNLAGARLGKYQLQAEIGRGGMGAVYRGHDPQLDRLVAIKVLAPGLAWREEFVERFLREARAAARLNHPNIVVIHDVGQEGGWYYYAMEYLKGQALLEIIRRRGPLSVGQTLAVVRPLAKALDYAHARGLVHRDIKPGNIIVAPDGRPTLTDFGIARAAQETRLTRTGSIMGTPEYMSPEQAQGSGIGQRSDQYALGVVAYEMLTGRVPFQADSTPALLHKLVYEPPPPLRTARPDLPLAAGQAIERALAKEPGERYESCSEFVRVLERAAEGSRVADPTRPPGGPPKRLPAWLWIGAGLGFAGLLLTALCLAVVWGGGVARTYLEQGNAGAPPPLDALAPSPTSTVLDSPTSTSVPSLMGALTPTPTATPTLGPSPTRAPTRTPSPSPSPTFTPTPAPTPCAVSVYGAFSSAWRADEDRLGCPVSAGKSGVWIARENFEGGMALWREDNDKIYVLYEAGWWERYDDIWREGDPEFACGTPQSPPTPKRGFGKIWCTYTPVRQRLGNATSAEMGQNGTVQECSSGLILRMGSGRIYKLFADGGWTR